MRAEIKALQQRLGSTTIYVTHDQIEAMTMADKIVVLHDGVVEQIGAPLELYDSPVNLFVAGFIGSPAMNFIKGRLEDDARPSLVTGSGFRMPLHTAPRAAAGRGVVLGVRPEHMTLGGPLAVPAELVVVEPTGYETQVTAMIDGQEVVCVLRERLNGRPGETIALSFDGGPLHFFDAETGRIIDGR
jgi:multiple sugar transport system ATP-binding protein